MEEIFLKSGTLLALNPCVPCYFRQSYILQLITRDLISQSANRCNPATQECWQAGIPVSSPGG